MTDIPISKNGKPARDVAIYAVKEAGNILLSHFDSEKKVTIKGKGNLVSEIDMLSERSILGILKQEYPDHTVLSEESNTTTALSGYTWVVDPLDGTNNYIYGIPIFCINISLTFNGDVLLAVTYDPIREELFQAEKGGGAYLNGSKIQVSSVTMLQDALVGFDLGYNADRGGEMLGIAAQLWGNVHCMRMIGSASLGLAYVACGRMNLYVHRFLYPWDIVSGVLLISEAGGQVVDWQGDPATLNSPMIIASNKHLCRDIRHFVEKQRDHG